MPAEHKFDNATAYELYMGRWSRKVAEAFITWLDVPPGRAWLDVGAGTGIVTEAILRQSNPTKVVGIDTSQAYMELAQGKINDDRVQFQVGDAANLDFGDLHFDASVAGLVLNFVSSPQQVVHTMHRLVRSGGLVAASVWDYADKMEMMRHFWAAAIKIDPSAAELDTAKVFTIARPENLKSLFEGDGLQSVEVMPIDIQTVFKDLDDFWQPFAAAQGSVSKYLRSLTDEMRQAIHDQLQKQLPIENDGSIHLMARAWAIKGVT